MRFYEFQPMPSIRVRLTHSREKLMRWLRRLDGDAKGCEELLEKDGTAALTSMVDTDAGMSCIVYMSPDTPGELADDAALLAHEATHVAQFYFADIGEGEPSDELQAYVIQGVTSYLAGEHFRWLDSRPCGDGEG